MVYGLSVETSNKTQIIYSLSETELDVVETASHEAGQNCLRLTNLLLSRRKIHRLVETETLKD